uniref:Uncharacterized protein n=1 Tax=Anguilla anguilla TaxID=7936 RepID=A0A0E9V951_ANGAN
MPGCGSPRFSLLSIDGSHRGVYGRSDNHIAAYDISHAKPDRPPYSSRFGDPLKY